MAVAYIKCPHCGQRMSSHSHKTLSPLYKTMLATCKNPKCLSTVSINVDIQKQIHPSLAPKPEIAAQLEK